MLRHQGFGEWLSHTPVKNVLLCKTKPKEDCNKTQQKAQLCFLVVVRQEFRFYFLLLDFVLVFKLATT